MKIKNFPIPKAIQLFIDKDLACELSSFHNYVFDKRTFKIWNLKDTEAYFLLFGQNSSIHSNNELFMSSISWCWCDKYFNIFSPEDLLYKIKNEEIIEIFILYPELYF